MPRLNYDQVKLRQELNKLYFDLITDLTVNAETLNSYEEADRLGFLSEVETELLAVDAMEIAGEPTQQQVDNKEDLKFDITSTIVPKVVPPASAPKSKDFDTFPL